MESFNTDMARESLNNPEFINRVRQTFSSERTSSMSDLPYIKRNVSASRPSNITPTDYLSLIEGNKKKFGIKSRKSTKRKSKKSTRRSTSKYTKRSSKRLTRRSRRRSNRRKTVKSTRYSRYR